MLSIIIILSLAATAFAGCPKSHPYAYLDGSHCCASNEEANRPNSGDKPPCDGGPLGLDSRCCKNDRLLRCPAKDKSCRNYELPTYRHVCYFNGFLKKDVIDRDECLNLITGPDDIVFYETQSWNGVKWGKGGSECLREGFNAPECRYFQAGGVFQSDSSATSGNTRAQAKSPPNRACYGPRFKWRRIRGKLRCVRNKNAF